MSELTLHDFFNQNSQSEPSGFIPTVIKKLEDTGLPLFWLQDHILKILYYQGNLTGSQISDALALPFTGVTDSVLNALKQEKLVEIKTSLGGYGEGAYQYLITQQGIERAKNEIERNTYAGPAPVPLSVYNQAILSQGKRNKTVTKTDVDVMLKDLVLASAIVEKLGPAVNSGSSIFLYGPPGNGKTSIARAFGGLVNQGTMYIPYSLFIDGQVIKLFDEINHTRVAPASKIDPNDPMSVVSSEKPDQRWVQIYRPFIVVGGELTLNGLDLVFNTDTKYYEAPFQVKANGGSLLIDDFGRQLVRPVDLLNRWIVPLENKIDFLTLHTGKKIEIPFDVMVVFSTNLPPKDLVDEAFLRRLRHKIEITDPSLQEYRQIFIRMAESKKIEYSDDGLAHLLREWYEKPGRKLRASHPRDICNQITDISRYLDVKPAMSVQLIDAAASSFFVEL